MMLVISADVFDTMERVTDMQNNIRDFGHIDVHDELLDWQTEDMHRKFPNVSSEQEYVSWFTQIWPRSRTYDQTHRTHGAAKRRGVPRARNRAPTLATTPRLVRGAAKRPILREGLFNRLVQRMDDLLSERLTWARTGKGGGSRSGLGGGAQAGVEARQAMLGPANYNP